MAVLAPPEPQQEKKEAPKFPEIYAVAGDIKERIVETVKSPFLAVKHWVRAKIDGLIPSFLRKEKSEGEAEGEVAENTAQIVSEVKREVEKVTEAESGETPSEGAESIESASEKVTGQEYDSEMPPEIKEKFIEAEKVRQQKDRAFLDDFSAISKEISTGKNLKRDPKLDALARKSLDKLNEEGIFEKHDEEELRKLGVAENYQIEYFETAAQAADFFRKSKKGHWKNMVSPYEYFGLAKRVVYSKKDNRFYEGFLVLYSGGRTLEADEVPDYKAAKIPDGEGFSSSTKIDALSPFLDALKEHLKFVGLEIDEQKKYESILDGVKIKLDKKEIERGSHFVTIKDKEGRELDYMISVNPPLAVRWLSAKKIVQVPFSGVMEDFRNVIKGKDVNISAEELEEMYETPSKEPNPRKVWP